MRQQMNASATALAAIPWVTCMRQRRALSLTLEVEKPREFAHMPTSISRREPELRLASTRFAGKRHGVCVRGPPVLPVDFVLPPDSVSFSAKNQVLECICKRLQ